MKILHRANTVERQHFLLDEKYLYTLKPVFLYTVAVNCPIGWKETPHSHAFAETLLVREGRGEVYIDDVCYHVNKGDLIVYNAREIHYEVTSTEQPMSLLCLAVDNLQLNELPKNAFLPTGCVPIFQCGKFYEELKTCYELLLTELSVKGLFYDDIVGNLAHVLIANIYRLINESHSITDYVSTDKLLRTVLEYVELNYLNPISLTDIATNCYLNKYYLTHLFEKKTNMTLWEYIIAKRVTHAQKLLTNSSNTISSIAEQSGFANLNYFCRAFKKISQSTPLEYRKKFTHPT